MTQKTDEEIFKETQEKYTIWFVLGVYILAPPLMYVLAKILP